jgi:hypothetical protein
MLRNDARTHHAHVAKSKSCTKRKVWRRPGTGVESKYLQSRLAAAKKTYLTRTVGSRSGSAGNRRAAYYEVLRADVPVAQEALRKLVDRRIEFRPIERNGERAYHLRWSIATTALMGG